MRQRTKPYDAQLAAWLVAPLAQGPITPNHLTTLRLLTGMAGAYIFAVGEAPNLAAWLIVLSNFLDHTDGELARLSGRQSRFGHNFDLVSDALVTSGMFIGIGIGLLPAEGTVALVQGLVAGLAVAAIFHLRNTLESRYGKNVTRQPRWGGFEAEDVLYLIPLMSLSDGLKLFLAAASMGAPIALIIVVLHYRAVERRAQGELS